ncbi:hypothetical protein R3W88_008893 [Solanum pinnatisectum]|uniref:DUF1985 domain-containing protein n=1 Tax=Solanum pinnatisectum TaxID=50273 RepID=A0AAV9M9R4_9SOLN|nr:hypothetical protein R3W88_008893 [Solanum pinnatisectum]
MFLREIKGSSKNAILMHVNGTTLRFTIHDFTIITGLKCSDNENDFVFNTEEPNKIILQYFGVWGDNDDDDVKFVILFYVHSFILCEEPTTTVIHRKYFDLLVFQNLSPTPMELKILELPAEYVQSDQSPTKISAANDSHNDFQDPPRLKNNKGKENVDTCSSPPKKKSRQTITLIQKKTPPRVISKQPCLRKSHQYANVPKRSKSPLSKSANIASYIGTKQNVEIKSCVASKIPFTSKSPDFSISRDEFDQFKILVLIFLIFFLFNYYLIYIFNKVTYICDGVEVTHKVPTVSVNQTKEPSRHSPSELNWQSIYNDLNDQEVHNNSEVPITFKVQNTSKFPNISEVQNTSEDLLNVIYNQTEKMEKEKFTDTNQDHSMPIN